MPSSKIPDLLEGLPSLLFQWVPGIKRPGLEVNHSPPSSAKVKNEGNHTSTTAVCLNDVYRDNFY